MQLKYFVKVYTVKILRKYIHLKYFEKQYIVKILLKRNTLLKYLENTYT